MINSLTGKIALTGSPHTKKISNLYLKEATAIVSTSFDGLLRVTSLCPDFDDIKIEL